ncbi:MAG TPA: universal stress protein [Acidimicrobiales bacterium]|nr:universal stress protein [Acidimicrobiales bacterium]
MDRVLAAVDGSEHALRAVQLAAELAARCEAELHLVHVLTDTRSGRIPRGLEEFERLEHLELSEAAILRDAAEQMVETAAERARTAGAPRVECHVARGDPAGAILAHAAALGADVVVVGRRGLGELSGLLQGSVSQKVTHHAACPVLTVP